MKFSGKNALVTGGSRGIGAQICRRLGAEGVKVWINYRGGFEAADALQREIVAAGGEAAVVKFDATNAGEFAEAVAMIVAADGGLDYLVNNAGITNDKLALRMSAEDFEGVVRTNLTSAFNGCKEAFKAMSKRRFGAVVNVASVVGEMGNAGQANYAASKGGMIAMTKSFAKECGARGVRFNAVTPGFIETDMTAGLGEAVRAAYVAQIALGRFAQPSEVASAVAFLLSDEASYITGEVLKINGGLYM